MLTAVKLIQTLPYEQQAIMHKLRELIINIDPTIVETVKWSSPVYSRGRNLLSIVPREKHVDMQIWDGVALCEKYPIIEGEGQTMRHLKVKYKGRNDFKMIAALVTDVLKQAKSRRMAGDNAPTACTALLGIRLQAEALRTAALQAIARCDRQRISPA